MPPEVSIIIVTLNRVRDLLRCLESLEAITVPALEVIVVDNGSGDGTVERVRAAYPEVRVLAAEENRGTSDSRNAAVRVSHGRFLWFLDDDTMVTDPSAAAKLVDALNDDPGLGGVGGEALLDGSGTIVGAKYLRLLPNGLIEGSVVESLAGKVAVKCLASCNLFVQRQVFEAVGGFDNLFFFHVEDLDLTWRIYREGYRLEVWADTAVKHCYSPSARRTARFTPRRDRTIFFLKNMTLGRILALPLLDLAYLLSPVRWHRLTRRARLVGHGARAAVAAPVEGAVTARGLWEAFAIAGWFVASLPVSYFLVLPHLRRTLAARRRGRGTLDSTDASVWHVLEPCASDAQWPRQWPAEA